jgi:CheY-like chemotaxis protein
MVVYMQAMANPSGFRVLFVEDDGSVAEMYKLKLELDGFQVYVATDGLMGLEMARSLLPDIILLDIRLPKMNGLDVLQALRAHQATQLIPAVILSNWNEREQVERAASLGALDHLTKSQTTPAKLSRSLLTWLSPGGPKVNPAR